MSHPTPQQEKRERRVQTKAILDAFIVLEMDFPDKTDEVLINMIACLGYDRNDIARALNQREGE